MLAQAGFALQERSQPVRCHRHLERPDAGGVNGKKIELITRDDNASPGDAVRAAEELVSREKIDVLAGAFLSNTGLALTDFAKQKKFFYLASEPLTDKIVWGNCN